MFSAVKLNLNIWSLNYLKVLFIELYLHKITTISSEACQSLIWFSIYTNCIEIFHEVFNFLCAWYF